MNTQTPNSLNNRGKYAVSMSDYFALLLITLTIIDSISPWWLFLLLMWGRIWLIMLDMQDLYKVKQAIKEIEKKIMKESAEKSTK